jgi:dipeptidyl aminopeptidase/acylaminoacyl peptidase
VFNAPFENVRFPSRDGVALSGWYIPARHKPQGAIILCHGMSANRMEMLHWAASLWENDFALLMFDFRRQGESGGDSCTAGFFEPQDLRGAVDFVKSHPDIATLPLGVFGFSMGGATAIMTAADDPRILAVATHGAFATLEGAITQRCRHHFGPFAPLSERIMMAYSRRRRWFVVKPEVVMPVNDVPRLMPRPLLLLHGERDPIIPREHAEDLYAASSGSASLHLLPRSRHRRINRKFRPEAHARVVNFFCDHLG